MKYRQKIKGFTLIELLMVISIIGLFASIVVAFVGSAREKARIAVLLEFDSSINHSIGYRTTDKLEFDNNLVNVESGSSVVSFVGGLPSYVNDGVKKEALSFGGSNFVSILNNPPRYNFDDNYTITLWFRTTTRNDSQYLARHWFSAGGFSWDIMGPMNSGRIIFSVWGWDGAMWNLINTVASEAGGFLDDGRWHHVVVERNYDTLSASLYIDGALVGTEPNQNIPVYFTPTQDRIWVGGSFDGEIDSLRIYQEKFVE